jgi:Phosphotransferase enzyme family
VLPAEGLPLYGGNSGVVIRLGDTVRRPEGAWTPRVQQFMGWLRGAGLTFVPQPLGVDDLGREVIEYVPGEVGTYPMPAWVWGDELLVDVARRMRELHDASADLGLPREGWRREPVDPTDVICHGDIAPYNTVCVDGRVVAFIDWDYAGPAPRGWDVGYAAYRWVSLTRPGHRDGRMQPLAEQHRRLELFCAGYGAQLTPTEVVRWAVRRLHDLVDLSRSRAAAGDPAFAATVAAGHAERYEDDAAWLSSTYLSEEPGSSVRQRSPAAGHEAQTTAGREHLRQDRVP